MYHQHKYEALGLLAIIVIYKKICQAKAMNMINSMGCDGRDLEGAFFKRCCAFLKGAVQGCVRFRARSRGWSREEEQEEGGNVLQATVPPKQGHKLSCYVQEALG